MDTGDRVQNLSSEIGGQWHGDEARSGTEHQFAQIGRHAGGHRTPEVDFWALPSDGVARSREGRGRPAPVPDRKSTRLNSSHLCAYRMPSSSFKQNTSKII